MQTLLRRLAAFGIALAALFSLFPCQAHAVSTSASSAILMDVDSGRVLYEQNADAKMLIASTTKILTALVAIREGSTRVLPVAMPPMTTLDRVVEMMPDLVDKVEKYFDKKEEKEPQ